MTTLHLGVLVQNYNEARTKRGKASAATKSTADVAQWLENRYGVMENFYKAHEADIAKALEKEVAGSLETMMMGGPANLSLGGATSAIEAMFKQAIATKEFDKMGIFGVPTLASLRGVNHRMAHPYQKRGSRPSFLDSGLYQASFKAWVD